MEEIHPEEERRVEGHIAPGRPSIGLDHVHLFPKKPKLMLGSQLCLFVNPTILTVVAIFLLLCFIATGKLHFIYTTDIVQSVQ